MLILIVNHKQMGSLQLLVAFCYYAYIKSNTNYACLDPVTSDDELDRSDERTKKVLEMVTVELSNNHALSQTPNGSLPSGTPNGSVPNMTPSSGCSDMTGEAVDADKISAKFPDLVEQAQDLEVKEAQGQGHESMPDSGFNSSLHSYSVDNTVPNPKPIHLSEPHNSIPSDNVLNKLCQSGIVSIEYSSSSIRD